MKPIRKIVLLACITLLPNFGSNSLFAAESTHIQTLKSPDGTLGLEFRVAESGLVTYSFQADGRDLIQASPVGFAGGGFARASTRSVDAVWRPVWGKREAVPDRFHETTLDMTSYHIVARAYDDGVAFKCVEGKGRELTRFHFAGDFTAWFFNGERHNLGPEKLTETHGKRLPVMTIRVDDRTYMAIHEADLRNGSPMALTSKTNETAFDLADGGGNQAWRVILFGRKPGVMVDSHLIELLNPPPAGDADFSWVKPGVAVWDWRINGATVDGFRYEMSLPSWKRMVDFAAENAISHLVLDANWYGPEHEQSSHPTEGDKAGQVREIIAYGKGKGVGVWLYLNDVGGKRFPIEQTLKQYGEWGAAGVKYGFMQGSPAQKNAWTQRITALCAQNRLLVNFHDYPVHPYGQMRTWPNAVTREFCHAQLDAHRVFEPKTFVTTVFVNMLAGPIDMNNGIADLLQADRVDQAGPVPSTLVGEAARTLIVFSGATIIPDIPENYRKHPDILRFIAAQKQPWRESKTLDGAIGEHIVMARQAADGTWLIGAATNEEPRTLDIPFTFLGDGRYDALVLQDGPGAGYQTRKESLTTENLTVTTTDIIRVKLAPGGGAAIMLRLMKN
jgi:alpha-glucosidase